MDDIIDSCYKQQFTNLLEADAIGEDYDIWVGDIVLETLTLLSDINDTIATAFLKSNDLKDYKAVYDEARGKVIEIYKLTLAISKPYKDSVIVIMDKLAEELAIKGTTYYREDFDILDKLNQLSKYTNNNTLQSIVISTISGDKYNIDQHVLSEQLYNLYLSYSRFIKNVNNNSRSNLAESLLELLIFNTSFSILFNIQKTELICQ